MSPTTPSLPLAEIKQRDIELLNRTLSMLCNYIWTKDLRPGEHLWSIPVDQERDFDCILRDAIKELAARRAITPRAAREMPTPEQIALYLQHVVDEGADHDDDCPGDDTCECSHKPLNDAINQVCRLLAALTPPAPGQPETEE